MSFTLEPSDTDTDTEAVLIQLSKIVNKFTPFVAFCVGASVHVRTYNYVIAVRSLHIILYESAVDSELMKNCAHHQSAHTWSA